MSVELLPLTDLDEEALQKAAWQISELVQEPMTQAMLVARGLQRVLDRYRLQGNAERQFLHDKHRMTRWGPDEAPQTCLIHEGETMLGMARRYPGRRVRSQRFGVPPSLQQRVHTRPELWHGDRVEAWMHVSDVADIEDSAAYQRQVGQPLQEVYAELGEHSWKAWTTEPTAKLDGHTYVHGALTVAGYDVTKRGYFDTGIPEHSGDLPQKSALYVYKGGPLWR